MSEPRILLCSTALDAAGSAEGLALLRRILLPNVSKVLITTGKFDAQDAATRFNVEAGYPPETAYLQSLAAWAEQPYRYDPRFRDGYDLFCLRGILRKHRGYEYAVLIRRAGFDAQYPDLPQQLAARFFVTLPNDSIAADARLDNVAFRLDRDGAESFLDHAWDLYASGTAYAIAPYSFDAALSAAAKAHEMSNELAS